VKQDLDRRLVAVMFTDMVGYTALFQADERLAMDKRDRYVKAVEHHHEAFGGTIVQRLGDGTMSMFPGALVAVHAAVEIQRELAEHDVPVRIGIHVGEKGRRLTIKQVLDLARAADVSSGARA
jgi:class 3 adenylate cyclase